MKKGSSIGVVHRIPEDLQNVLFSKPTSKLAWKNLTPLARNEWICWVMSAKKPETRAMRIERTFNDLLVGKRRPCCWPGCLHRRPSARKWFK